MINKLTNEQKIQLIKFREECLSIGLSTERIDRTKNQPLINYIYKEYLNIDTPPYIWYCESPLEFNIIHYVLSNLGANLGENHYNHFDNLRRNLRMNLRDNLGRNLGRNLEGNLWENLWENLRENLWENLDENLRENLGRYLWENLDENLWENLRENLRENLEGNLRDNLRDNLERNFSDAKLINIYWSNLDIYWLSFYLFPSKYLGIKYNNKHQESIDVLYDLFKNCGYLFFYKDICFITERPITIHKNSRGQLHCNNGPSVEFSDGFSLWYLNGVKIPKEIILTKAEDIDPSIILKETNVEIRREIIRKIGIERVIEKLGAKSIEINGDYELLNFDIIDGTYRPYLKMKNPSIDTWHIEGVHPDCKSIKEALVWRNNGIETMPIILT